MRRSSPRTRRQGVEDNLELVLREREELHGGIDELLACRAGAFPGEPRPTVTRGSQWARCSNHSCSLLQLQWVT